MTEPTRSSRRAVLTAATTGAAAAAVAMLTTAVPVAALGDPITIGDVNTGPKTTIKNTSGDALEVVSQATNGVALFATSNSGTDANGIRADSSEGTAVAAVTGSGAGVDAIAQSGTAVRATTTEDDFSAIAVRAFAAGAGVAAKLTSETGWALEVTGGRIQLGSLAGVATLPAGATSVTVSPGVPLDSDSGVIITPLADPGARRLWVVKKLSTNTFSIRTNAKATTQLKIAYLLLG